MLEPPLVVIIPQHSKFHSYSLPAVVDYEHVYHIIQPATFLTRAKMMRASIYLLIKTPIYIEFQ